MHIESYEQLINLCESNILEAFSLISIDAPKLELKREQGYWYVNTKEDYREFNMGMVSDIKNLERLLIYYEISNTNGVIYTDSANKELEDFGYKTGYLPIYTTDLMLLPEYDSKGYIKADEVVVRKVTKPEDVLIANKIESEALEFPLDGLNRCFGKKALATPAVSLFIADKYDYPAGVVTVIKHKDMLSIWGMAVASGETEESNLQHLGIGEHLLRNVLDVMSKEHPNIPFILLATDAGKPLYTKLGFQTIKTYTVWAK